MWISLGNVAEVALIFAQTDPEKKHKGLACFLVPTDSEGFSTQEIHGKLGLRASDTAEISLDGVEVGDDALMGEVGDGFKVAMSALDSGRYSVAAGCVGIIEGCVQASVAYAKERRQFDVPIASFQLVQEMIADMVVRRDAARMLVRRAGLLKDAGKPSTIETSVAKLYATESAVEAANLAIQVHGGSGYVDDYPVERYLRDARVTTLYEGTSQIQKLIIGRDATGINAMVPARRPVTPLVETSIDDHVALCRLNRPEARNALSPELMADLAEQLERFDADTEVRCIVIAGSDDVFAAGADIRALSERQFQDALFHPAAAFWKRVAECRTPLIAAVSGFALGGGCELALICDMIVASETAEFGQPEITLGIIPGGGGTQRLARAVGKQRAMELVLTGRRFDAEEAARMGIVNQVTGRRDWLSAALELAARVASRPPLASKLAKQAVLAAEETGLTAGLEHERRLYELAMATEDRVEGMQAFLEKRRPEYRGR